MGLTVKKKIEIKSLDELSFVLGTYDENLTYIARELELLAYVDGMKICIEGAEENVRVGEETLQALIASVRAGDRVDASRVAYCIEIAK